MFILKKILKKVKKIKAEYTENEKDKEREASSEIKEIAVDFKDVNKKDEREMLEGIDKIYEQEAVSENRRWKNVKKEESEGLEENSKFFHLCTAVVQENFQFNGEKQKLIQKDSKE